MEFQSPLTTYHPHSLNCTSIDDHGGWKMSMDNLFATYSHTWAYNFMLVLLLLLMMMSSRIEDKTCHQERRDVSSINWTTVAEHDVMWCDSQLCTFNGFVIRYTVHCIDIHPQMLSSILINWISLHFTDRRPPLSLLVLTPELEINGLPNKSLQPEILSIFWSKHTIRVSLLHRRLE